VFTFARSPAFLERRQIMDPMLQSQIKDWVLIGVMVGLSGSLLYIVATAMRRKQQNEMQRHMLDKFAAAKDFADFVQSPAGQKYVMSFSEATTSSHNAILSSVRTGLVLLFAGAGIAAAISAGTRNFYVWGIGIVLCCLGVAFWCRQESPIGWRRSWRER
jgi:thymidine phosphorylase